MLWPVDYWRSLIASKDGIKQKRLPVFFLAGQGRRQAAFEFLGLRAECGVARWPAEGPDSLLSVGRARVPSEQGPDAGVC